MKSLQQKTISGIIWSSVQRFGAMTITFAANVILARLLSPSDFGCVGMLMIFIGLSNTFIDGGFGAALIQKKEPTQEDYSTIFYWNILLSIILYILLYITAPLIAKFYHIPLLSIVLRVQGVVLIFNALSVVQNNLLRKQLRFKQLSVVEIVSAILSLILAIAAALNGWGVWSLVIQQIALSVFKTGLLWTLGNWYPNIVFSFASFRELFKFGSFMLLSNLFSTLSNEIQGLLVGRVFSPAILGLYTQSYRLEGSMATAVSGVIDQVTYPVMSSIQDEKGKLILALRKFVQIPAYICALVMGLMIVVAKPLILLVYGENWLDCVPYFQILCTAGLAVCLQGSANNSIAAIGKSSVFFKWTIVKRSVTIILCVVGIWIGGMHGMLWMSVLGAWVVYVINAYLVDKYIGYRFIDQFKDILPFIVLATLDAILVYYIGSYMCLNIFVVAIIQCVLYISVYLVISWLFKFESFVYIENVLKKKFLER